MGGREGQATFLTRRRAVDADEVRDLRRYRGVREDVGTDRNGGRGACGRRDCEGGHRLSRCSRGYQHQREHESRQWRWARRDPQCLEGILGPANMKTSETGIKLIK